ncbi:MAG: hypothetical protein IPK34_01730 [Ramlibacter sp.]|jgi:hypothetical protein|nr:hypothetical protein [Ramlibacter sp.]
MLPSPRLLLAGLLAWHAAAALAQAPNALPASPSPTAAPSAAAAPAPVEPRVERLRFEDAGSRVDELRVGGETRSITVQPGNGAPAWEVVPDNGLRTPPNPRDADRPTGGQRVWKVLAF